MEKTLNPRQANACITGIAEKTRYKSNGESKQLLRLFWPYQETNVCVRERERDLQGAQESWVSPNEGSNKISSFY
jgi:hypothetical protein